VTYEIRATWPGDGWTSGPVAGSWKSPKWPVAASPRPHRPIHVLPGARLCRAPGTAPHLGPRL